MEGDQWNKKLWNRIANNTISWLPNAPEPPYLWLSFIGRSDWPKGYWMYHRKTIYLDVQFADEGELVLSREGQQHIIPSGAMAIIPPGEYRIETKSGCRKRHFGISGIILNNNLAAMNLNQVSILPDFRNPEFEELYQSLFFMTVEKDPEKARQYCAKSYQMLLLLSDSAVQSPYPEELQRAITFINRNFPLELSLEKICRSANCGKSTMQQQFKCFLNMSPIRYLIEVRMKYALKLLENTPLSIKDIAEKCGYDDQLYFSGTFRRRYGCSPREYRKNGFISKP